MNWPFLFVPVKNVLLCGGDGVMTPQKRERERGRRFPGVDFSGGDFTILSDQIINVMSLKEPIFPQIKGYIQPPNYPTDELL